MSSLIRSDEGGTLADASARVSFVGLRASFLLWGIVALAFIAAPAAWAASPEQELANRYAPIVALKDQEEQCDRGGEGWRPTAVGRILGNPAVRLRAPAGRQPLEERAPTASDLFGKGEGYYLDFPGNPLDPGCTYERDARRFFRGQPSIAYAHIVQEPGSPHRLALQYWLYYYFNDFNNNHESDWEGIQLSFEADSARDALGGQPLEVGYAQHGGGERAAWDSKKLERVGSHPVVYVASGSHASHYSSALWLGRSASEGWGCDDTRGPSHRIRLDAVVVPTQVGTSTNRYAWLAFEGRWGQRGNGPNNGPTGPNTNDRWTEPLTWQDELRDNSFQVPALASLGQSVTGAFCGTVSLISTVFTYFGSPVPLIVLPLALLALLGFAATRTTWRPAFRRPMRARRASGQILSASTRIYWRHKWLLLGIGAVSIPFAFAAVLFEELVHWRAVAGWMDLPAWTVGIIRIDLAHVVVDVVAINATTAIVLDHLDTGRPIGLPRAYGLALRRFWSLVGAIALELVIALVLLLSIVGTPWLIRMLVGWALTVQEVVIDRASARSSLRSARKLVKGNWWWAAVVLLLLYVVGLASAPIVGFALLLVTSVPPEGVNLIGSLVYALTLPYIAVATTLVYFDLQARQKESAEAAAIAGPEATPTLVITAIRPRVRERVAAVAALLAAVGALVLVASAVLGDLAGFVQAFACVLVVVVGSWFALTRRGLARLLAVIAVLLGLAALVVVELEHWPGFLLFGMVIGLLGAFGVAARTAMRHDRRLPGTHATARGAPAAQSGVLIINPKSGGGKAERFELAMEARKRGLQPVLLGPGDDLRELAERAFAGGADVIGMAGGDGSQAVVATVAMQHDAPHVCIPAGTRNHFALDLGLDRDDVVGALDAFTDGVERRIDLARVNDRVFVNNASLGGYARVVQLDAYRAAKLETWARTLPEMLGSDALPSDLEFDGPDARAHAHAAFVLVSNNPYQLRRVRGAGTRPRLDTGRLGIVAARIDGASYVAKLVTLATVGRSRHFGGLVEWSRPEFEVRSASAVAVGLDGEALLLEPPLRFVSLPAALRVRLPRHAPGVSPAAAAVALTRNHLVALLRIAAGRPIEALG